MADPSQFEVTTFQRRPGIWRASIMPIAPPTVREARVTTRSFITEEDSVSEADAEDAARKAIRAISL
jgi:hypothetical protein